MVRTQIYLTEEQKRRLEQMAAATGKRQSDLIRSALDEYLAQHQVKNWKEALQACFGMWRTVMTSRTCMSGSPGIGRAAEAAVGQVLIDSCVLIDVLRGHARAGVPVRLDEPPLVAAFTIGELFSGAHRPGEEARIIDLSMQLTIVPADFAVARLGGKFCRQYGASHGITLIDALIAASARLCRVPLVTRNVRHFPMLDDVVVPYRLN